MVSPKIATVTQQKGGVGKTVTTVMLARAAVLAGRRTLVVDMDPQGDCTSVTARDDRQGDEVSIADVLSSRTDVTLSDAIVPGIWDRLDVLPSGPLLADVQNELVAMTAGREYRLRSALADLDYDLILIDCPPQLDLLTVNSLTAARAAVVVVEPSLFGANSLAALTSTIEVVKRYYNTDLRIGAVIVNGVQRQTVHDQHWLSELRGHIDGQILEPVIPRRTWIREAVEGGMGLDELGMAEARFYASVYADYLTAIEKEA